MILALGSVLERRKIMENNDSILNSVKKMLGLGSEYNPFDTEIIIHINSVFASLSQMGVGPTEGFMIEDSSTIWSEFIGDDKLINNVKSYMYLKVKLLFDPPTNSALIESINNQIRELEYRLYIQKGGY